MNGMGSSSPPRSPRRDFGKSPPTRKYHRHMKSAPPLMADVFGSNGLLEEEAEAHLVTVLEERRARATSVDKGWTPSVQGETPPLRRISIDASNFFLSAPTESAKEQATSIGERRRMSELAMRVRAMKAAGKFTADASPFTETSTLSSDSTRLRGASQHREIRGSQRLFQVEESVEEVVSEEDYFQGVGGEGNDVGHSKVAHEGTDTNRLISGAMAVAELFNDEQDNETIATDISDTFTDAERLPLIGSGDATPQRRGWFGYQNSPPNSQEERRKKKIRQKVRKKRQKWLKKICCIRRGNRLAEVLHPTIMTKAVVRFLRHSWFTRIGVPCLIAAFILFYQMNNPVVDFMDQATLSWWLVFVARQCITLELAYVTEYALIDVVALRSRLAVRILGPLITLMAINSKGWPFISVSWALIDMFILHGDNLFQQNWLYFSDIKMFSESNYGGHIIESNFYLRVLLVMVFAGCVTAIKRTSVAMYLGKKTFVNYKPRLEIILEDITLIIEVAELAYEAENLNEFSTAKHESINFTFTERKRRGLLTDTKWTSMKFQSTDMRLSSASDPGVDFNDSYDDAANLDENQGAAKEHSSNDSLTSDGDDVIEEEDEGEGSESDDEDTDGNNDKVNFSPESDFPTGDVKFQRFAASNMSTGTTRIKNLLDRWDEPNTKTDKSPDVSISDILKFRKALTYMDETHPFSMLFGPASTRDECIKSARETYQRLMKCQKRRDTLSMDVISLLAFDAEGNEDARKKAALKRLFRPDQFNELSLLAFVQACDAVYRKLRYFRASVGNSSLIDKVLEQIIDGLFSFILVLVILTLLEINPWPLLVSISTLLVSFAFAVGPSTSRYIEGILLIAARRPYDLGDRILIVASDNVLNHGVQLSWFVEDINLFSTTVRFAATNEVATLNNGSIALARIVNCARSPNALVTLTLRLHISATDEKIDIFREALDKFVKDRPRTWEQILFFRCDFIDPNNDLLEYTLRVRHVKAWQDAASILINKSELDKFCFEMGKKLDLHHHRPIRRHIVIGETQKDDDKSEVDRNFGVSSALLAMGLSSSQSSLRD